MKASVHAKFMIFLTVLALFSTCLAPPLMGEATVDREKIGTHYLVQLKDGYPTVMVRNELIQSGIRVVHVEKKFLIVRVSSRSLVEAVAEKLNSAAFMTRQEDMVGNLTGIPPQTGNLFRRLKHEERVGMEGKAARAGRQGSLPDASGPDKKVRSLRHGIHSGGSTHVIAALDQVIRAKGLDRLGKMVKPKEKSSSGNQSAVQNLSTPSAIDDGYEENDVKADAAEVTAGTYASLSCRDDDWFKVYVNDGQDLVVTIDFVHADGNLDMTLEDAAFSFSIGSHSQQDQEKIRLQGLAAGWYFIRVYGHEGATNLYSMTVETGSFFGSVSGRVTDNGGTGISGVVVYAFDLGQNVLYSAWTDANGDYELGYLPAGSCKIYYDVSQKPAYFAEWYNDKADFDSADPVAVTAGNTSGGIDAVLAPAGIISGRITSGDGAGISNVYVNVYDLDRNHVGFCATDANGDYIVGNLSTGAHKVYFDTYWVPAFVEEWYNDKTDYDSADEVSVTVGGTTGGVDVVLAPAGFVSGRVTDSGGSGIENIFAIVHDSSGLQINNSWTDANGDYAVGGVPTGAYKVRFATYSNPGFVSEWYNDKMSFETADPVSVTAGSTTSGINAVLAEAGFIAGRVTDDMGSGIAGIYVYVNDLAGDYINYAWTDVNGDYTVGEVPTGSYKVEFDPYTVPGFMSEWYNDKTGFETADPVSVTAGSTTSGIDAVLTQAGIMCGRVTDSGGNGIQDIAVYVFDLDYNYLRSAYTDSSGNYTVSGFSTGTYKVQFVSGYDPSFANEWYNDKPDFMIADPVSVTAGSTTSGIDAVLTSGGPIGVMLTAPNGGENWTLGDFRNISWRAYGVGNTLKLALLKDGAQVGVIASGVDASAGGYAWTVGEYIGGMAAIGSGYTVKIKEQGTTVADESDAAFTISAVSGDTFIYNGIWEDGATAGVEGWHPGDYDGDGIVDLLNVLINYNKVFVSDGTKFIHLGRWLQSGSGLYGWFPGDYDGDGKTDLMRFTPANAWGPDRTQVFVSTGTAFVKDYIWSLTVPGPEGYTVGDFNGDGMDDMLIFDSVSRESQVHLSNGSEFQSPSVWFTGHNGMDGWYCGDFNGDGRTDLARTHADNGTVVLLSSGSDFQVSGVWTPALPQSGGWLSADINGDGMDDLLRCRDNVSGTEVFLSTGAAFQYDGVWSDAPAVSAAWRVGDFSGDTRADLLAYDGANRQTEVYLSTAAGSSSGALKAIRDANHLNDGIDLSRPVLPQDVEDELLAPWLEKWRSGAEGNFFYRIKREYEEQLGHKVRDGVIYRMLDRYRKENSEKVKVKSGKWDTQRAHE